MRLENRDDLGGCIVTWGSWLVELGLGRRAELSDGDLGMVEVVGEGMCLVAIQM